MPAALHRDICIDFRSGSAGAAQRRGARDPDGSYRAAANSPDASWGSTNVHATSVQ